VLANQHTRPEYSFLSSDARITNAANDAQQLPTACGGMRAGRNTAATPPLAYAMKIILVLCPAEILGGEGRDRTADLPLCGRTLLSHSVSIDGRVFCSVGRGGQSARFQPVHRNLARPEVVMPTQVNDLLDDLAARRDRPR
jgi:hypothetical protein